MCGSSAVGKRLPTTGTLFLAKLVLGSHWVTSYFQKYKGVARTHQRSDVTEYRQAWTLPLYTSEAEIVVLQSVSAPHSVYRDSEVPQQVFEGELDIITKNLWAIFCYQWNTTLIFQCWNSFS
jgi:hypothetical protein